MKYDKYGDPIEEKNTELNGKQKIAFTIFMIIQIVLILLNIVILLIPALNGYLCFITAPIYIFMVITYAKTLSIQNEAGRKMTGHKAFLIISILAYVATAVLAVFGGIG